MIGCRGNNVISSHSSCSNVNFAFRGACNLCGSARPAGAAGVAGGGGRGKGRAGQDSGGSGRPVGGGLFGPNDWPCPMYDCVHIVHIFFFLLCLISL